MTRKALMVVLAVLGGAALVPVVGAHRQDLATALALLVTVCPAWLSVAVLAEAISYLTRGGATRAVLRGSAPTVGTAALAAITVVGDAVAYVLPLGFAAGGAVAVGQTRRRGASRAAAVRAFAAVTLVGVAVLTALGVAAAGIAAVAVGPAVLPSGPGLLALGVAAAGVAAAVALRRRRAARRDGAARPHARGGATWGGAARPHAAHGGATWHEAGQAHTAHGVATRDGAARPHAAHGGATWHEAAQAHTAHGGATRDGAARPHARGGAASPSLGPRVAARLRGRWAHLHLPPLPARALRAAAVGMLLSWVADLAVLALAFVALGERPPWVGLALAYCLGQAASALPFTPGGLAVVEGGLTAALVAFGACPAGALTAVLLYRLISHWVVVPAGGLAWLLLRCRATDEFRGAAWSALAEGVERCPTRT